MVEEETINMRTEFESMAVSSPTHISNLHHCTVIHRGAHVIALDSCTSLEQTVYRTSNPWRQYLAVCQYQNTAVYIVNDKSRMSVRHSSVS